MAIQMRALRTVYVQGQRKEYKAGDVFSLTDDKEAQRHIRSRRAERVSEAVISPTPAPKAKTQVVEAENPADAPPFPEPETEPEVTRPSRRGYRRRDLKAEE